MSNKNFSCECECECEQASPCGFVSQSICWSGRTIKLALVKVGHNFIKIKLLNSNSKHRSFSSYNNTATIFEQNIGMLQQYIFITTEKNSDTSEQT